MSRRLSRTSATATPSIRSRFVPTAALLASFGAAIAAACSSSPHGALAFDAGSSGAVHTGNPSSGGTTSSAADGGVHVVTPTTGASDDAGGPIVASGPVTDFPSPIIDGNAPPDAGSLFGAPTAGAANGGPCLYEPEVDSLYPQNWLRPRFSWSAVSGQNLFELRLQVANQLQDLVVYTTNTTWTMPKAMWDALRTHSPGEAMTLTIRGGVYNGGALTGEAVGTSGPLGIAPVQAGGSVVYWTTSGSSALMGFSVGDESVVQVLTPSQTTQTSYQCIGCHTSTPDGEFAAFSGQFGNNTWPNALALIDVDAGTVGTPPSYLGAGGAAALAQSALGIETFTSAHWSVGDRKEVVALDPQNSGANSVASLEWIDVEASTLAAAHGTIERTGDPNGAGAPAWSHDGNTIAYVSTNHTCGGRLGRCDSDYQAASDPGAIGAIYTVPYAGGAGGVATPLKGASDPSYEQYYPAFSPDDAYIAFNKIQAGLNMYDQTEAELYVIPSSGGTATRLSANDPPACVGKVSPGITNSWPKWSPLSAASGGNTYYWLIFSSTRSPAGNPQLYMTSMVVAADGTVTTHGSVYLWNQPAMQNNHTPAWDHFKVPPQPPAPQ